MAIFRSRLIFIGALLTLVSLHPGDALQVSGLYQERVAVSSESESERNRAYAEAMRSVILKVTGDPQWLDHPTVSSAIRQAQSYVEAISFTSEMVPAPEPEIEETEPEQETDLVDPETETEPNAGAIELPAMVEQRYINVTFASTLVDEMLASADIPVWDSNRPSVLVWMALQSVDDDRTLLNPEINPEIVEQIQVFARERGLPVIFPVLDFEDRQAISVDEVWTLEEDAIANASRRYGADSILAGRLLTTASGEMVGLWQFQFQDGTEVFDGFATELADYLDAPVGRITTRLARYFAIVPEFTTSEVVRLRVDGVGDLADYSSLMTYVRGLSLVQSVIAAELDGQRIELQLGLQGNSQQLNQLIALDRDLLPIESTMGSEPGLLHYRWTR